jgi:hypothetical protein
MKKLIATTGVAAAKAWSRRVSRVAECTARQRLRPKVEAGFAKRARSDRNF